MPTEAIRHNEKAMRDYKLVVAARDNGDERAYADLMRYYRNPIYMMLLRMTHNPTEADDLTIETFGKAFCQLSNYSPAYTFSTWLFSIASNRGIDYIRRRRLEMVSLSSLSVCNEDDQYEYPLPSDVPDPEEQMIASQRNSVMRAVVQQLQPRYRKVVELRFFEELSYEEIAERLRLPMGTVKIQLRRARMLLAEILNGKTI